MTKLVETNYVITLSKAVRDRDTLPPPVLNDEIIAQLEEIIGELAEKGVVVEITTLGEVAPLGIAE